MLFNYRVTVTSSDTSMPLKRHSGAGCALLANLFVLYRFVPEADIAATEPR